MVACTNENTPFQRLERDTDHGPSRVFHIKPIDIKKSLFVGVTVGKLRKLKNSICVMANRHRADVLCQPSISPAKNLID